MSQPQVLQLLQQRVRWQQRSLQQRSLQQRCLQHRCLQQLLQLLSQPQLGAASQVGAGAAQLGAAQEGAAQPQPISQAGLQQRWNRWQQRCLQHLGAQQVGWQPQVGSQPQVLSQPQPPPLNNPWNANAWDEIHRKPTAITAAKTRLFMAQTPKGFDTGRRKRKQRTHVSPEPPAPRCSWQNAAGRDSDLKRRSAAEC